MAAFLSEPIKIKFTLPSSLAGTNLGYNIFYNGEVIYKGSVYVTGKVQTLYLNDILYNLNDSYEWFNNFDITNANHKIENSPFMTTIRIDFDNGESYPCNVIHANVTPNGSNTYKIPSTHYNKPISFNAFGTGVLPRLPKIPYKEFINADKTPQMFMMAALMLSTEYTVNNDSITFSVYNGSDVHLDTLATISDYITDTNVSKCYLNSDVFSDIQRAFALPLDAESKDCYVGVNGSKDYGITKLFMLDNHPAEYYVVWINRWGAWQCQPMCAKNQMSETVTTQKIITVTDETIPCAKTSEFKWTLNSHWLNYAEHEEFESLLTSKYVYLFNTKTFEGHYVTVTDSNWTFKNAVNTSRPFNLTLNLTKSYKQNIIL